jgi:peptidoglycan/LPS O-acetylase OafA/YrhL
MLFNLHVLRVIAALGVVYFHATSVAGLKLEWDVGSRGVDVFFVISGFIIAYIGTSRPEQFFLRRLIRVVPFYWAATLFVFGVVLIAPQVFRSTTASVPHLISSLLFVPHQLNGEMLPTLQLGWSLNFEMFFYVTFALSLRAAGKRAPIVSVVAIVSFVLLIHALAEDLHPITDFYSRPIVLEFCYGIGVFYAFDWCSRNKERLLRFPALKQVLLAVLALNFVALVLLEHATHDRVPRYLVAGIPSFFIVLSALLVEKLYGVTTKSKLLYLLGEASYIVYLIHPYIVFSVLRVLLHGKSGADLSMPVIVLVVAGLLALTSAISIAIHLWFEKPLMAFLRAKLT